MMITFFKRIVSRLDYDNNFYNPYFRSLRNPYRSVTHLLDDIENHCDAITEATAHVLKANRLGPKLISRHLEAISFIANGWDCDSFYIGNANYVKYYNKALVSVIDSLLAIAKSSVIHTELCKSEILKVLNIPYRIDLVTIEVAINALAELNEVSLIELLVDPNTQSPHWSQHDLFKYFAICCLGRTQYRPALIKVLSGLIRGSECGDRYGLRPLAWAYTVLMAEGAHDIYFEKAIQIAMDEDPLDEDNCNCEFVSNEEQAYLLKSFKESRDKVTARTEAMV